LAIAMHSCEKYGDLILSLFPFLIHILGPAIRKRNSLINLAKSSKYLDGIIYVMWLILEKKFWFRSTGMTFFRKFGNQLAVASSASFI
jgi:hypothetical protein